MITQQEIRVKLLAFLRDEISLNDFGRWLVQRSWNMHRDSSPAAQAMVGSVELALAEHSDGHQSLEELRREFASLLSTVVVNSPPLAFERSVDVRPARRVLGAAPTPVYSADFGLARV